MINVTCRCGFTAGLLEFTATPVFGDLPKGHFQCPACGVAWCRKESEHKILRAGSEAIIIPGRVDVLLCEAWL